MTVEINEAIVLVIACLGFIPIIIAFIKDKDMFWMLAGYAALLGGTIFTIVENFIYPNAFNLLEHGIGIMIAALFFLICAYKSRIRTLEIMNSISKKSRNKNG